MPFRRVRPWERPPSPRAWYGRGAECVFTPSAPALQGSLPVQVSLAGRPSVTWDGRVPDLAAWAVARAIGGTPALLGDARLPDGRPVGERVIRRLEAALKPPSRQGLMDRERPQGTGAGV